ncbi:MAG: acyltransferase family protein, partial [Jatrophihabitantaceae bacterium]
FWSLAVEEQYYLVWPLLLVIVYLVSRGAARRSGLVLAAAMVLVPSFVYSITYTTSNPSQAYFVTTTRMWELAMGGLVALTAGFWNRLAPAVAALIGWLGVTGIVYSALTYTAATLFPGSAAGLPVLSAAAVILAGPAAGSLGPVAILGRSAMVILGNISYSLYLWHWPIIVFVTAQVTGALPLWAGLLAAAASLVPAYLSYRFVETPGMRAPAFASTGAGLRLGFITTMASIVAAMLLLIFIPQQNLSNVSVDASGLATDIQGKAVKIGAQVLGADPRDDPAGAPRDSFDSITPDPLTARTQDVPANGACSRSQTSAVDVPCVFGAVHSKVQIDLVGDSHAMQWEPALDTAGRANNWRVVTHTKAACPFSAASLLLQGRPYSSCIAWNKAVTEAIIAERPQLVITSEEGGSYPTFRNGQKLSGSDNARQVINGYTKAWRALTSSGIQVAALAETPLPGIDVPTCVSENLRKLSTCARPRSEIVLTNTDEQIAAERVPAVHYVDLNDVICPTSQCAAVIGGIMIYRDANHLSATYVRTTAVYFAAMFAAYLKK